MFSSDQASSFEPPGIFLIGHLVESVGLEPKTVRFYERAGLIKPGRLGNLRVYSGKDIEVLKVIKFLRSLDLSIRIIKGLIDKHGGLQISSLPLDARITIRNQLNKRQEEFNKLVEVCRPILESGPEKSN